MPEPIVIAVDHAQRRLYPSAVTVALRGEDLYDPAHSTGVFMEPIRRTVMLRPRQLEEAWATSNIGDYAKYTIGGGYEVNTSGKWREPVLNPGAGTFLQCDDASGEWARTSSAVGLNRGMVLTYFAYANGERKLLLECGYSSSAVTATGASTGFKVYTDGLVEIYRGGTLVESQYISGAGASAGRSTQNEYVTLLIIPCRRKELILFSTAGQGFHHVLDDIEESETAPVITANEKFFVAPGSGITNLQIQFTPLRFPTTGTLTSLPYRLAKPPQDTQTIWEEWYNPVFTAITEASLYGDLPYAGSATISAIEIRNEANTGAYVADGDTTALRVRQTFTGDGSYSPFLYGAIVEFAGTIVETDDSERFEILDFTVGAFLSVPDDPFGATLSLYLKQIKETHENVSEDPEVEDWQDVEYDLTEIVPHFREQSYRPIELIHEGIQVFDGFLMRPRYEDGLNDLAKRFRVEAREIAALLEETIFRTQVPFDGWPLCQPIEMGMSAVAYVLEKAGIDLDKCRLSDLGYIIAEVPGGGWNIVAEEGDSCRTVLEKLHRLAADCVYGSHPTVNGMGFWFVSPEDLEEDEPKLTLYRTLEAAMAANPELSEAEAIDLLYDGFHEEALEVEANEVRATGYERRTRRLIQSYAIYQESQDPTIPPSARVPGWVGNEKPVGVAAHELSKQEDTDKAVEKLYPIATGLPKVCEWFAGTWLMYETEPIGEEVVGARLPLWRMDKVHIDEEGDRLISATTTRFARETEEVCDRPTSYCGGTIRGHGGVSLKEIRDNCRARLTQPMINDLFPGSLLDSRVIATNRVTP